MTTSEISHRITADLSRATAIVDLLMPRLDEDLEASRQTIQEAVNMLADLVASAFHQADALELELRRPATGNNAEVATDNAKKGARK